MRWRLKISKDKEVQVELLEVKNQNYYFRVDGRELILSSPRNYPYSLTTDQCSISIESWTKRQWRAVQDEKVWIVEPQSFGEASSRADGQIRSQMPGRIVEVCVSEGQEVEKDQKLLIMEAMKMENEIRSENPGKIKKIHIQKGQSVESDQLLIEFES